jgi:hypothetical protein
MTQLAPIDSDATLLTDPNVFQSHLASLRDAPQWLLDLKTEAWERFQRLPMPQRMNSCGRFAHGSRHRARRLPPGASDSLPEGDTAGPGAILQAAGHIGWRQKWQG